jgi:hypothetical protein
MAEPVAIDPQLAVLRQLASAYDRFCETEQVYVSEGRYAEAQGAHQFAVWILRAYQAEEADPEVKQ